MAISGIGSEIMRSLLSRITLALLIAVSTAALGQSVSVNDGGTWRPATEVYVNDAGTWREIQEIYVNDGGTWRLVFSASNATISNATYTDSVATPTNASTEFFLESDGDIGLARTGTSGGATVDIGDWLSPKTGMSGFDVRCTVSTGALTSGDTCDGVTWLNLAATKSWRVARISDTPGLNSAAIILEIRKAGAVQDTATITLEAAVTA